MTPWTMCATATAIMHWNAIPVFADIEQETFCIDPKSVERNISKRTKAIIAVDIFGHPCDSDSLRAICDKYSLKLITDTAQAPGTTYGGRKTGTFGDVGGFSLNYHKHIHTGEGGILVTNDDLIARKLTLIRNHAEAVVDGDNVDELANMLGYNFRLGEIECAMGIEQLKKLDGLISRRQAIADRLTNGLRGLQGLRLPVTKKGCTHAYYMYPMVVDVELIGVSRGKIIEALTEEGVKYLTPGYANIHMLPMYQKRIAYGSNGFPWTSEVVDREVSYAKGICPIAEELHDKTYMGYLMCMHELEDEDITGMIKAFRKVWNQIWKLK